MLAFEVSLNGKVLYTAGIGDTPMVSTWVRALEFPQWGMRMSVHTSRPKSSRGHGKSLWWGQQALVMGDAVTIRIVDVDKTDEPSEVPGPGTLLAMSDSAT